MKESNEGELSSLWISWDVVHLSFFPPIDFFYKLSNISDQVACSVGFAQILKKWNQKESPWGDKEKENTDWLKSQHP